MDEQPLTHDQMVCRIQAFYDLLRKDYEEWKVEKALSRAYGPEDEEAAEYVRKRYEHAADLLDLYTHTFENVLYTWIH